MSKVCYAVRCQGEIDQLCDTKQEAQQEAKDLRDMGFDRVSIKQGTWAEFESLPLEQCILR